MEIRTKERITAREYCYRRFEGLLDRYGDVLFETEWEVICDALQCYAAHPEFWACDEDINDVVLPILQVMDAHGYNYMLPKFDALRNLFPKGICPVCQAQEGGDHHE